MLVKNPRTKMIINKDDSHLTVLQLRRKQRKEKELMEQQIAELQQSMLEMRSEIQARNKGY